MQALHQDAEADGAQLLFNTRVLGADVTGKGMCHAALCNPFSCLVVYCSHLNLLLWTAGPTKAVYVENVKTGERQMLRARSIVNAAGLWAQVCRNPSCHGDQAVLCNAHANDNSGCPLMDYVWRCSTLQSGSQDCSDTSSLQCTWLVAATLS